MAHLAQPTPIVCLLPPQASKLLRGGLFTVDADEALLGLPCPPPSATTSPRPPRAPSPLLLLALPPRPRHSRARPEASRSAPLSNAWPSATIRRTELSRRFPDDLLVSLRHQFEP